jgi:hypothetical protein
MLLARSSPPESTVVEVDVGWRRHTVVRNKGGTVGWSNPTTASVKNDARVAKSALTAVKQVTL